ncbi:unnamed protein product [Symbiodinium natans]|uniref:Uncharacterized protein n=1 Tax=Symbiodinium natans TaxID=878477 RepID=A0A812ICG7_9DINO|nr:unnamed protein product [Symbiodinium natans]
MSGPHETEAPVTQSESSDHSGLPVRFEEFTSAIDRCVTLLLATFQCGGHVCLFHHPQSAVWKLPLVQHFLLDISALCVLVEFAQWQGDEQDFGLFASSFQGFAKLASDVTSRDRSEAVIQTGLRSPSIPVSLATATIEVLSPMQPASGPKDLTVAEAKQLLPSKPFGNPPFAFQDGGGIGSCPDWSCPPPGTPNVLLDLRQSWMSFLLRIKLPLRLRDLVRSGGEGSLFTYEEIAELRSRFQLWARRKGDIADINWQIDDGQPYCLHALRKLISLIMDKDTSLFPCLIEGVPTGFDKNIPKSNVFAPRGSDSTIDAELLLCEGNWSSAEANPELLRQLVAKEVEAGYLVPVSLEEARQRWPNRLAVGKLSIVSSDGRPDRLVVDNSICNTNALCEINETYTLPLLGSVRACLPLRGLPCELAACTIDVVWIGWCVNVRAGCFSIPRSKRLKLHLRVQKLLADPKNVHKRDLHKDVFDCIDEDMRFIRAPTGTAIPVGAKLLEVKRKLSANSIAFLQFWLHWCKLPTLLRPLQFPARTTMVAAADAMGSGTKFAIGGFVKLSTATIWFSECFQLVDFAFAGIELSANASDNISCYECLAQIALLHCVSAVTPGGRMAVRIPSWTRGHARVAALNAV